MAPSAPTLSTAGETTASSPTLTTTEAAPRRRRRAPGAAAAPLGSLLQTGAQRPACPACGGEQLTVLSLTLTDGTAVRVSSCRGGEHRRWDSEDEVLSITQVLERTRA